MQGSNMNYVIADLEATCWEGCKTADMEIIEIGAVLLDGASFQPLSEFDCFVRPVIKPELTTFCLELTGIRQNQIDKARKFPDAFSYFLGWIGPEPFKLCSWGDFDYEIFILEGQRHDMSFPDNFAGHINLKELYARAYDTKPSIGLREAMRKLNMPFEGRLHRGIDDAWNIAKVAQTMLILDR